MTNYWQNVFCIVSLSGIVSLTGMLILVFQKKYAWLSRLMLIDKLIALKATIHGIAKRNKLNMYQKLVLIDGKHFLTMKAGVNSLQLNIISLKGHRILLIMSCKLQSPAPDLGEWGVIFRTGTKRFCFLSVKYFVQLTTLPSPNPPHHHQLNNSSQLWEREFIYKASPLIGHKHNSSQIFMTLG